jgi:enoyl-CoA hydratase/carnithine racemase
MSELVLTETNDAVATVTINRPEKRNALSIDLRGALAGAFEAAASDANVAVVVLTGAGSAFCAGMDRTQFGGDRENRTALYDSTRLLFDTLIHLPLPVVAAVNGPALGGGFDLACVCDLRIAAPQASFGHPEITFGVPPSYGALLRVLPDQIARELAFTGRTINAEEALALGIVREVQADALARAQALAREIAQSGRTVLEQTKRIMIEAGGGTADRALDAEMELFKAVLFRDL